MHKPIRDILSMWYYSSADLLNSLLPNLRHILALHVLLTAVCLNEFVKVAEN